MLIKPWTHGPWTHECCFEVMHLYAGSGLRTWSGYCYYHCSYCYYHIFMFFFLLHCYCYFFFGLIVSEPSFHVTRARACLCSMCLRSVAKLLEVQMRHPVRDIFRQCNHLLWERRRMLEQCWNWRNQSVKTLTMSPHAPSQSPSLQRRSKGGWLQLRL